MFDHIGGGVKVLEICAGAGGQSLGLEQAGFEHLACVEIDRDACETLRMNRPGWNVVEADVHAYSAVTLRGQVDLLAGGVPCPPFSVAGKQLGANDERDLFPEALRLVDECRPAAVMIENVRGIAAAKFTSYRNDILTRLAELGYEADWQLLNASDYGVSQLRPRTVLVAMRPQVMQYFEWPAKTPSPISVGELLRDAMGANGWKGADLWAEKANAIAPTLVGGSRKHGGPDLGPTRARAAWLKLGVNGIGISDAAPGPDDPEDHVPKLTASMAAAIQGFPPDWRFSGRKTASYRQVGNAFPPPVAKAVGEQIMTAIRLSLLDSRPERGSASAQLRLVS